MKKIIKVTSVILLFAMLLPSLISCGNAEFNKLDDRGKAAYIINKTNEHYKNSLKQSGDFTCVIEGKAGGVDIKIELDGSSKRAVSDADGDKMKFVNVTTVKSQNRTGDDKKTENYTETTAFQNGFMYMGYDTDKEGAPDIRLKSALSAKDFSEFLTKSDIFPSEPNYAEICDNVTVSSAALGTRYVIKITHSKDNQKDELTRVTNELTSAFGIRFDLVNLEIEYTVDASKLVIKSAKVKYVTETPDFGDDQLRMTYEGTVNLGNPGTGDLKIDNEKDYSETGDLRYAFLLSEKLTGLISAERAGYKVTSKSTVKAGGKTMSNSEETDVINCGYKNDVYVYSINAKANLYGQNVEMDITYNGVQQKVDVKGAPNQTTATNEIVARMFLINILNTVLISPGEVSGVNIIGTQNGVTTVELELVFGDRYVERLKSASLPVNLMKNRLVKITAEYDAEMNVKSATLKLSTDYEHNGQKYDVNILTIVNSFGEGKLTGITPVKPKSIEK